MGRRYGRPTALIPPAGGCAECHPHGAGDIKSHVDWVGECAEGPLRIAGTTNELPMPIRKDEDPSIFAIELETLAVKDFGDIGQSKRVPIIRERFVTGHRDCDLRRHLDSFPSEHLSRTL